MMVILLLIIIIITLLWLNCNIPTGRKNINTTSLNIYIYKKNDYKYIWMYEKKTKNKKWMEKKEEFQRRLKKGTAFLALSIPQHHSEGFM